MNDSSKNFCLKKIYTAKNLTRREENPFPRVKMFLSDEDEFTRFYS